MNLLRLCRCRLSGTRLLLMFIPLGIVPYLLQDNFSVVTKKRAERVEDSYLVENILDIINKSKPFIPKTPKEMPVGRPMDVPNRFLIEEKDFCQRRPGLRIIGYLHSAIKRVEGRTLTRKTWGGPDVYNKYGVKMAMVFIVGRAKDEEEQRIVDEESQNYHDIIQVDFEDYYELLGYKALSAMLWISRNCRDVPWTVHGDDDVLVDDFYLDQKMREIESVGVAQQFYCHTFNNMDVYRDSKLNVSVEQYPKDKYPRYCAGPFWFMPTSLAPRLLAASRTTNFVWIDDAFLTGILAETAGIGHTDVSFNAYWKFYEIEESHFEKKIVWILPQHNRLEWWNTIVLYHTTKNLEEWKDDPNASPFIPKNKDEIPSGKPPEAPSKFLIEEADFCDRHSGLRIISFIYSKIGDAGSRTVSRRTWANMHIFDTFKINIAFVFVVGRAENDGEKKMLEEESNAFHDIIQVDFDDQPDLLVYKGLAALVWVARHCSKVPWTLHADVDGVVDLFLLDDTITDIESMGTGNRFYCYAPEDLAVKREGPQAVSAEQYPREEFPSYCSGKMWFIQTPLVPKLLVGSRKANVVWLEDVYITGLAAKQAGVGHTLKEFNSHWSLGGAKDEDLGQKIFWTGSVGDRTEWWGKIARYHMSRMLEEWKDDPNATPFLPPDKAEMPIKKPADAPNKFLIEEADFCHRHQNLHLIGYIHTAINRVEKRDLTRRTWASADVYDKYGVKSAFIFIVGKAKNAEEERIVKEESEKYRDIVQIDFVDQYELLGYKALGAMVWLTRHCSHVPWTLHGDDDVLLDDFLIEQKTKEIESLGVKNQFYCAVFEGMPVLREGRYKVPYEQYNETGFPRYCSGPTWFMPTFVAPKLLAASKTVDFVWIDDAYLTGFLAREAGVGHVKIEYWRHWNYGQIKEQDFGKVFAFVGGTNPRTEWWQKIVDYHAKKG